MGIAETLATVIPVLVEGRGRPSEQDIQYVMLSTDGRSIGEYGRAVAHPPTAPT